MTKKAAENRSGGCALSFYAPEAKDFAAFLPGFLLQALKRGHRIMVRLRDAEEMLRIDALLWSFDPAAFLGHATEGSKAAHLQKLLLSTRTDANPNAADMLVTRPQILVPDRDARMFARLVGIVSEEGDKKAALSMLVDSSPSGIYWQQAPERGWLKRSE